MFTSPLDALWPRFSADVNTSTAGIVTISTDFPAVDPVFYCLNAYRKEMKTLGFLLDGPLRRLRQSEVSETIHPALRVMYAVPDPDKCIFNGLKESKDTGRSRTAFLGKLGKLSELEALCGLSFDVIVLDLCSTSEALSEKLPEYLPEHKIVFMRRYTARQFGCPASDSGCIFGLTKRPPTEKGLEALRRLMSVQLEQCIDLESYHTSDVQWHYFGDAPTACGTEASSDPAAAQPPPAVQGTTDADEPGRDSCVCCRPAMSGAKNQGGGREIDVPKVTRCLSRRRS